MRANICFAFKQVTSCFIYNGFWFGYSKCRDIWQMTNQGLQLWAVKSQACVTSSPSSEWLSPRYNVNFEASFIR